jgi:hypothetical protein
VAAVHGVPEAGFCHGVCDTRTVRAPGSIGLAEVRGIPCAATSGAGLDGWCPERCARCVPERSGAAAVDSIGASFVAATAWFAASFVAATAWFGASATLSEGGWATGGLAALAVKPEGWGRWPVGEYTVDSRFGYEIDSMLEYVVDSRVVPEPSNPVKPVWACSTRCPPSMSSVSKVSAAWTSPSLSRYRACAILSRASTMR